MKPETEKITQNNQKAKKIAENRNTTHIIHKPTQSHKKQAGKITKNTEENIGKKKDTNRSKVTHMKNEKHQKPTKLPEKATSTQKKKHNRIKTFKNGKLKKVKTVSKKGTQHHQKVKKPAENRNITHINQKSTQSHKHQHGKIKKEMVETIGKKKGTNKSNVTHVKIEKHREPTQHPEKSKTNISIQKKKHNKTKAFKNGTLKKVKTVSEKITQNQQKVKKSAKDENTAQKHIKPARNHGRHTGKIKIMKVNTYGKKTKANEHGKAKIKSNRKSKRQQKKAKTNISTNRKEKKAKMPSKSITKSQEHHKKIQKHKQKAGKSENQKDKSNGKIIKANNHSEAKTKQPSHHHIKTTNATKLKAKGTKKEIKSHNNKTTIKNKKHDKLLEKETHKNGNVETKSAHNILKRKMKQTTEKKKNINKHKKATNKHKPSRNQSGKVKKLTKNSNKTDTQKHETAKIAKKKHEDMKNNTEQVGNMTKWTHLKKSRKNMKKELHRKKAHHNESTHKHKHKLHKVAQNYTSTQNASFEGSLELEKELEDSLTNMYNVIDNGKNGSSMQQMLNSSGIPPEIAMEMKKEVDILKQKLRPLFEKIELGKNKTKLSNLFGTNSPFYSRLLHLEQDSLKVERYLEKNTNGTNSSGKARLGKMKKEQHKLKKIIKGLNGKISNVDKNLKKKSKAL